jgi:hypothetical protein
MHPRHEWQLQVSPTASDLNPSDNLRASVSGRQACLLPAVVLTVGRLISALAH